MILTFGGFHIVDALGGENEAFYDAVGFFLMAWFIFTTLIVIATLRSSAAFFLLFFTLDCAFLLIGTGYLVRVDQKPHSGLVKFGGVFCLLAAFCAWYNTLAGVLDHSNSFFVVPLGVFPWNPSAQPDRSGSRKLGDYFLHEE